MDNFTVIIPAKNLCSLTKNCIETVNELYPKLKVILLLDEETHIKVNADIMVIKNATIGEKRNLGVQSAQTKYVAFIDSDAAPIRGWLENALPFLEKGYSVTGPNLPFPGENRQQRFVYLANLSYLVRGLSIYEKVDSYDGFVSKASSCNLVMAKDLYGNLGGMNPALMAGEDLDLSRKIIKVQKKIYFSKDVKVYHRNRMFLGFLKQQITYGFSDVSLVRMAPGYLLILAPFFFQIFMISSLSIGIFFTPFLQTGVAVLFLYLALILYESLRIGRSIDEKIGVIPYIFAGNFFPGIGVWLRLFKPKYRIYHIYNNNE